MSSVPTITNVGLLCLIVCRRRLSNYKSFVLGVECSPSG